MGKTAGRLTGKGGRGEGLYRLACFGDTRYRRLDFCMSGVTSNNGQEPVHG